MMHECAVFIGHILGVVLAMVFGVMLGGMWAMLGPTLLHSQLAVRMGFDSSSSTHAIDRALLQRAISLAQRRMDPREYLPIYRTRPVPGCDWCGYVPLLLWRYLLRRFSSPWHCGWTVAGEPMCCSQRE